MGGPPRLVEIVENTALVKERRFGGVQIFGLRILGECAAAEGNDASTRILDREHDAVAEAVIGDGDILARNHEARFRHLFDGDVLDGEKRAQCRAVIGSIAKAEFLLNRRRELAIGKIAARFCASCRLQRLLEEFRRQLHHIVERSAQLLALLVFFGDLRHRQAGFLRQPLDGFRKVEPFLLHQKGEDVARGFAAKAVIAALAVLDMEGRRLLIMKGTACPPVAARGI